MNTHKFDVEDAEKHGVKKAIILEHLKYHQESNTGNSALTFNGKVHAYIKKQTVEKMFPYFSYQSVKRWLNELEDDGIIESCKPKKSNGDHLKYYHVKGHLLPNSQNESSKSQNDSSMNSQNESSSIVTNVDNHNESAHVSVVDRIENAENVKSLLNIWVEYRKEKNKYPNLYEKDMLQHKLSNWGVAKSKAIIKEAITNGWLSLKEEYISDNNEYNGRSHFRSDAIHL